MFTKSIRWQLQIWQGLILCAVVIGFCITAYHLQRNQRLGAIDDELQQRTFLLSGAVRPPAPIVEPEAFPPPPRRSELPPVVLAMLDGRDTNDFYFAVWLPDGRLQRKSPNAPEGLVAPEREASGDWRARRTRGSVREYVRFTSKDRAILVGVNIADDLAALRRLRWSLSLGGSAVLALALAGGWWAATRSIRPIHDISGAAAKIAAGDLSQRIDVAETHNELGHLATVLNSTFARLEAAFQQQKQFTADAAHELRTPLSVIISEIQTSLTRERSPAEYREGLEACLDTAQQMRRLIESLLDLARLDGSEEQLGREPVDLAQITHVCIDRIRPLGKERNIQIQSGLVPVKTLGNPTRIGQVLTNLLTNAINYNKPNGEVRVSTFSELHMAVITISDNGPGIAPDDLPHIFERFYRGEKSRSRAAGHTGLGLAICKAIIETHGGSIQVWSRPDVGTTFTLRLPLLHSP